jgi:hypothetical protein
MPNKSSQPMPGERLGSSRNSLARHGWTQRWMQHPIRKSLLLLLPLALILGGCRRETGATNSVPLSFYAVSDNPIEGGRLVDMPGFPQLGYVGKDPDLVIGSLKDVYIQPPATFVITLTVSDASAFTALTSQSVGKRLLVMLGAIPVSAPFITAPIPTPTRSIALGADMRNLQVIKDGLGQLTGKSVPERPAGASRIARAEAQPLPLRSQLVTVGMTFEEVEAQLGKPDLVESDDEGNKAWYYFESSENRPEGYHKGGQTIVFVGGKVLTNIPVMVHTRRYGGEQ